MVDSDKTAKVIETLVETTDALLRGEYNSEQLEKIDAEGLLSTLTNKINKMVVNLKNVETSLTSVDAHTPNLVDSAKDVVELMAKAANTVLDKSDQISAQAEELGDMIAKAEADQMPEVQNHSKKIMESIRMGLFDVIASQSYQDVARQKLETLISDLNNIRDWLVDAVVILNIRKDQSPENLKKKAELLREVSEPSTSEDLKQDLVDDLLSEFGF